MVYKTIYHTQLHACTYTSYFHTNDYHSALNQILKSKMRSLDTQRHQYLFNVNMVKINNGRLRPYDFWFPFLYA